MILDNLIENNEFPIIFIGSGISKRYIKNSPDWNGLLEEFWNLIGNNNFYGNLNNFKYNISKENPTLKEEELNHYANMEIASRIEDDYNQKFNLGELTLPNFTPKNAHYSKVSPFKKALSNRFENYKLNTDISEIDSFKNMLLRTQIILTTNYDTFIEDSYNEISTYEIHKYIGQNGFFKNTFGYSEIYKIHGCVSEPNEIIITKDDYEKFDKNSVLISARIISLLIHSPIIFLGYSLTDTNVRKIIKDFTFSLSKEEVKHLENKLILIERDATVKGITEEIIDDRELGCKVNIIKTDNFNLVYDKICQINQGIAPSAVRKYQHIIKQLIIDKGKEGTLNTVLVSPEDIDQLAENIQNKNITVAIGDAKHIFQIPDIVTYCLDYISEADNINTEIRLRFAVMTQGRFPVNRILKRELVNESNLHPSERDKLINRINEYSNFDKAYKSIVSSSVFVKNANSMEYIMDKASKNVKKVNLYETISYNIKDIELNKVKRFIIEELELLKSKGDIKLNTQFRRLLLLYDILNTKEASSNHRR